MVLHGRHEVLAPWCFATSLHARSEPTTAPGTMIETPKRSENGMVFTFSCSTDCYDILCRALKLRYWIDLGSDSAFDIDWQDVKDNSGAFIEHIIKVAGVDSVDVHNLYTITLYDTKAKVMIQENCREEWVMQEFPKFKSIVEDVISSHSLSLREAYLHHTGKNIDFQELELLFSDCEEEELNSPRPLEESANIATESEKIPTKKRKPASPRCLAKSTHPKPPRKTVSSDAKLNVVGDFQNIGERLENVESSIRDHDLSALAVDLTSMNFEEKCNRITSDFDIEVSAVNSQVKHDLQSVQGELRGLRDELINVVKDSLDGSIKEVINNELESLRVEFTGYVTDFKVQIKNELAVLRQSVTDSLDADQTARNIEKDDVRKLQSRLDSTCDKFQHASQQIKDLQGRINILENSNAALRKQIELLEKKVIDTPQDESCGESSIVSSTESPDLPAPTEEVVTSAHGSQTAPLTNNPAEFTSAHGSQTAPLTNNPANFASAHGSEAPLTNNPAEFAGTHGSQPKFKNDPTDIAILMDSNRKFLDPTKLCYNQNVKIIPCGNIQSTKSIISESRLKNPQILVFNTGVNDVEGTDDASTIG